jgi:hypothetical protein
MDEPMSIREARRRARIYVDASVNLTESSDPLGSIRVEARDVPDVACFDVKPSGGITVVAQASVSGADPDTALRTLAERWIAEGCQVLDDRRGDPRPRLKVQSPDGFWLRAAVNVQGELMITVSSPCLWPESTSDGGSP